MISSSAVALLAGKVVCGLREKPHTCGRVCKWTERKHQEKAIEKSRLA